MFDGEVWAIQPYCIRTYLLQGIKFCGKSAMNSCDSGGGRRRQELRHLLNRGELRFMKITSFSAHNARKFGVSGQKYVFGKTDLKGKPRPQNLKFAVDDPWSPNLLPPGTKCPTFGPVPSSSIKSQICAKAKTKTIWIIDAPSSLQPHSRFRNQKSWPKM